MIFISYTDKCRECVACGQEFTAEDDIVVCPVCGAPHHRSCWIEEGHCHYEIAHGTDLQWHPKEQPEEKPTEEPAAPSAEDQSSSDFSQSVFLVRCPHCGKAVPGSTAPSTCRHCGEELPPVNPGVQFGGMPFQQAPPANANEPIDESTVGKLSRIVMQRKEYYIPRFQKLKKQGNKTVSWNWAAFFFSTYWLAYRKCYIWAIFSSLIELVALLFLSPMSNQISVFLSSQQVTSYTQAMQLITANMTFSQSVILFSQIALGIYLIRAIVFGLFGNLIYKNECLKRSETLDAMPKEDAMYKVFKLSGVSIFAPIIFYYLLGFLESFVTKFI